MPPTATDELDRSATPALPPTLFRLPDRRSDRQAEPEAFPFDPSTPAAKSSLEKRLDAAISGTAALPRTFATAPQTTPTAVQFGNTYPAAAPQFDADDTADFDSPPGDHCLDRDGIGTDTAVLRPETALATKPLTTLAGIVLANKTIIGLLMIVVGAGWYSGRGRRTSTRQLEQYAASQPANNQTIENEIIELEILGSDAVVETSPAIATSTPADPSNAIVESMPRFEFNFDAPAQTPSSPPTSNAAIAAAPLPPVKPAATIAMAPTVQANPGPAVQTSPSPATYAGVPRPETDPTAGQILTNPFVQPGPGGVVQTAAARVNSFHQIAPAGGTLPTPATAPPVPPATSAASPYTLSRTPAGVSDWRAYLPAAR